MLLFHLAIVVTIAIISCKTEDFITPETIGKSVFQAFQNSDLNKAKLYIMRENDYREFINNSTLSKEAKNRVLLKKTNKEYLNKKSIEFETRFHEIIKAGLDSNIIWKDTKLEYIAPIKPRELHNGITTEIYIVFSYKGEKYGLELDDCYKCPRGWLMADEPRFHGKIDSNIY